MKGKGPAETGSVECKNSNRKAPERRKGKISKSKMVCNRHPKKGMTFGG